MYELTIIIPVFNEAGNLGRLENELLGFEKTALKKPTFLFVNDGSTDGSKMLIEAMCGRNESFRWLSLKENYGLSTALKAGFDSAETPFVGYIDADLQTRPEDFNLLLERADEFALVSGRRENRKDGFLKRISSKTANAIRRAFTGDGMRDSACPLKIMKTEYAKGLPLFKGMHRFLPALVLLQNGKVVEIPVNHFPRRHGKSNFGLRNRSVGPLVDCFVFLWMKKKYIRYELEDKK